MPDATKRVTAGGRTDGAVRWTLFADITNQTLPITYSGETRRTGLYGRR